MSDEIVNTSGLNVKFDLRKLTAKGASEFFNSARLNDYEGMSEIFAQVIVECPAQWGAVNDPQTYFNLPVFGEFKQLIKAFVDEVNTYSKN